MNIVFRKALYNYIINNNNYHKVISNIDIKEDGSGTITYNPLGVFVDPAAPGFTDTTTNITDEEMVRADLITRLATKYSYNASPKVIEIERTYKSVGRPGKGGRIDVLVRNPDDASAFLFIECKAPDKYDIDYKLIEGQLFRLSRMEKAKPTYLVYYTTTFLSGKPSERSLIIDGNRYSDFDEWDEAGQPTSDILPKNYGIAPKRNYANVDIEADLQVPLNREVDALFLNRVRAEIHDVIWGGGGTNNNEVFVYISKLILCKIYDEKETRPGDIYQFQRMGAKNALESPITLVDRMNNLYRQAEIAYLALSTSSINIAFDPSRIAPSKIAYVVGRLESVCITDNIHEGDLLGDFFEQIVSQDFTQTKGQFFTPMKIVNFMLSLCDIVGNAKEILNSKRDQLGRPRLPYVIDPSCGSGTFLIEYMKQIRREIGSKKYRATLPERVKEMHDAWFAGRTGNTWAKDFLFGIENNYDLGLAAKVNMVLHGDGSMNTWVKSGILPFDSYWIDGRHNLLGIKQISTKSHPYSSDRNEQFDLVISNPPFSLKMSPDEQKEVQSAFDSGLQMSEVLFIERWYQLLNEKGKFCCILPESILDTSTNENVREFLLKHFRLLAIVSLPYDTFKPFTSTKTCIVYAEKRTSEEILIINKMISEISKDQPGLAKHLKYKKAFERLGMNEELVFMAEPESVGYKRRKNLSDLLTTNDLYFEELGESEEQFNKENNVLSFFKNQGCYKASSRFGFSIPVTNVFTREGLRLDPKYRWLWDFSKGVVIGHEDDAIPLSSYISIVDLPKFKKGELNEEYRLIDLECVDSREGFIDNFVEVSEIGSDKVLFTDVDILFSKLEPYLGKVIILAQDTIAENAIGSTEWIGIKCLDKYDPLLIGYLLMLPEMCDAYRRLQSGKRHARLDPKELLELRLVVNLDMEKLKEVSIIRGQIILTKRQLKKLRKDVDNVIMG